MSRDELAKLLEAKDDAKRAMSAAYAACNAAEGATLEARLSLDLDRKRALKAYCAADSAYDAACAAFVAQSEAA